MPQIAATASKSRPALVVRGELTRSRTTGPRCQSPAVTESPSARGIGGSSTSSAAASQAHAIRHGCRAAASPPEADGKEQPGALVAGDPAGEDLPLPDGAVGPEAGSVIDRAHRVAGHAVLGEAGGEVRMVVLDADGLDASRSSAYRVER